LSRSRNPALVPGIALKSAIAGTVLWLLLLFINTQDSRETELIVRVFLFAVLVIVPLALFLLSTPRRCGKHSLPYRLAVFLQPAAGVIAALSFLLQPGLTAGLFASFWLLVDLLIACFGLWRLFQRGVRPIEELSIDVAMIYLPVAGIWFVISRLGVQLIGFGDTIILLTAVHFHFAGFAAPIIVGMTGRMLKNRPHPKGCFQVSVVAVIAGTPLVAAGITFSPLLALVGAAVISLGLILLAGLTMGWLIASIESGVKRFLLLFSSLSSCSAMVLACTYAYSIATKTLIIDIPTMAVSHGLLNAFGFAACGLVAWSMIQPVAFASPPGIPFSRLPITRVVGPMYFENVGACSANKPKPHGLVDRFSIYDRSDFNVDEIATAVQSFYEETFAYNLTVKPHWQRGFRFGGRLAHWLGSRVGQLCLPVANETRESQVETRLVPVDDKIDGRSGVRGWIRTYKGTNIAMYVAAYSTHTSRGVTYMNIAFPLTGGNLSSVLHLRAFPVVGSKSGVVLSTLPCGNPFGDQGVYFANPIIPLRLPMNETITVWVNSETEIKATHEMWLFGFNFLNLDYDITSARAQQVEP
jgi:YndJ-like protein